MAPHSSTLAWKIHRQRSLVGCSPWGREESGTTERLYFHFPVVKTLPSNAGCMGSIPSHGARIPHPWRPKDQNIKGKQYCNKFNINFLKRESRAPGWKCHTPLKPASPENLGLSTHWNLQLEMPIKGLPQWLSSKESTCSPGASGDMGSTPGLGRFP